MKKGDKVVCINNVIPYKEKSIDFTVNEIYTINSFSSISPNILYINNDFDWEVNCEYPNQFNNYFILLTEYRKLKLLKINGEPDEDRLPLNTNTK